MSEKLGELYLDIGINQQQIGNSLKKMETQVNTSFKSVVRSSQMASRAISMALGIGLNQVVNNAVKKLRELESFKKIEIQIKGIAGQSLEPLIESFNKIFKNLSNSLDEHKETIKSSIDTLVSVLNTFAKSIGGLLTFFANHPKLSSTLFTGAVVGKTLSMSKPVLDVASKGFDKLSAAAVEGKMQTDLAYITTMATKKWVSLSEYYSLQLTSAASSFISNVAQGLAAAGKMIIANIVPVVLAYMLGDYIGKKLEEKLHLSEKAAAYYESKQQNQIAENAMPFDRSTLGPAKSREGKPGIVAEMKRQEEQRLLNEKAFENYRYKLRKAQQNDEERFWYQKVKGGKVLTEAGAFLSNPAFQKMREEGPIQRGQFTEYFRNLNEPKRESLWNNLDIERKRSGSLLSGSMGYMSAGFLGSGFESHITPGEKAIVKELKELQQTIEMQTDKAFQLERTFTG